MLLEAFRLVPHEEGRNWSTVGAVMMLVAGAVLIGLAMGPYLPARLRAALSFDSHEDVNVRELIGALVLPGLTFIAFGVGVFLKDIGYFLIMVVVALANWRWVVRPSQRAWREAEGGSEPRTAPGEHHVEVHDVRPLPDEKDRYEPYFIALCDCGWVGEALGSGDEAFEDVAPAGAGALY
jgi:hypothetical protein